MGMIRTVITIFYRMVGPLTFMQGRLTIDIRQVSIQLVLFGFGTTATTLKETTLLSWNVCGTTVLTRHEFCGMALFIFCVKIMYDVLGLYFLSEYFWESMGHRCSLRLILYFCLTHTSHVTDPSVLCIRGRFYMKRSRMYLCRFSWLDCMVELAYLWKIEDVIIWFRIIMMLYFMYFIWHYGPLFVNMY